MTETSKVSHKTTLAVRSYECDIQGIVNNAVYQNYLEYARHEYLKANNIDFVKMHDGGRDLVIIRAELDYKASLRSDEEFYVLSSLIQESRLKYAFMQKVYRSADEKLMLSAKMIGTCIKDSKPIICDEINDMIAN